MKVVLRANSLGDFWAWRTQGIDWQKLPDAERYGIRDEIFEYIEVYDGHIQSLARRLKGKYQAFYEVTNLVEQALAWSMADVEPVQVEVHEEAGERLPTPYNQIVGEMGEYVVMHTFPDEESAREARYRGEDVEDVMMAAGPRWKHSAGLYHVRPDDTWEPIEFRYRLAMPKDMVLPPRLEL